MDRQRLVGKNSLRWFCAAACMVGLGACGTDIGSAPAPQATGVPAKTMSAPSSATMPPDLRAAYIASVQREAPESYAAEVVARVAHWENPAQRFSSTLDPRGLTVSSNQDDWHLAMRASAVGCESEMTPLAESDTDPHAEGNRVEIAHEGLTEWYVNGPLGVEQGFVLHEAPACAGPKTVTLAVKGDLLPALDEPAGGGRGDTVRFVDSHGRAALSYSDLFVTDAHGKAVPAWLSVHDAEVALVVDDAGAAYPLAIDPLIWVEQAKLVASDGASGDRFGISVSLSGDTALVGAYLNNTPGGTSGSAYVFVRSGAIWTEQAKLVPSDAAANDQFGYAVSLSADTAIVGAHYKNNLAGAAYVFVRSGMTWTEQAKLLPSDAAPDDRFGVSVSLSGDTAIVGAHLNDDKGSGSGSAYVFVRNGTLWTEQAKLLASDGATIDLFGFSVSLSGDTAIVGAYQTNDKGTDAGSAYVFVRNGTLWTEQAKLLASDGAAFDWFGVSVSLSGDTALVGASQALTMKPGAAYVFVRNGTTWTEQAKLVASDGAAVDQFGVSVSLSGDTAIAGSRLDDDNGMSSGSAYVFVRNSTAWTEQTKLLPSVAAAGDQFGSAVSLSGDTALVSAPLADILAADAGVVYVFALRAANGDSCLSAAECASGFCTDGVCCNIACGDGNATDCQACSVAAGAATDGMCAALGAGTECRAAAGNCDVAESCSGAAIDCPADVKVAAATECRAAAGNCDVAESCDGAAIDCPADAFVAAGTECRAAAGDCDAAESCDGAAIDCPADALAAAGTECRAAAGACDVAESCDGAVIDCPADALAAAGTECRAAAGACDVAESCDGVAGDCPADAFVAAGTECRAAAGACDVAESCDGVAGDCPADAFVAAGTECRAAAGDCDAAESCDGAASDCPADANAPDGTVCTDGLCMAGICEGQGGSGGAGSGGGGSGGAGAGGGSSVGAGNASSSSSSGGDNPSDEGGCACRAVATQSQPTSIPMLSLLGLALLAVRRRRID